MPLDLANYEQRVSDVVRNFWKARGSNGDEDNRQAVVGGKNLDSFTQVFRDLVVRNGLSDGDVHIQGRDAVKLPGFFRATKQWDLIVVRNGHLIAALELKSQVGSFGNNFNNRSEEAIGSANDLWTAFRDGAFSNSQAPFLGYLMLLEDSPKSNNPVKTSSPHFEVFPEFSNASYARRYQLLCEKLVSERLYTAAALVCSPRSAAATGKYSEHGLQSFVSQFAAHIAAHATP